MHVHEQMEPNRVIETELENVRKREVGLGISRGLLGISRALLEARAYEPPPLQSGVMKSEQLDAARALWEEFAGSVEVLWQAAQKHIEFPGSVDRIAERIRETTCVRETLEHLVRGATATPYFSNSELGPAIELVLTAGRYELQKMCSSVPTLAQAIEDKIAPHVALVARERDNIAAVVKGRA